MSATTPVPPPTRAFVALIVGNICLAFGPWMVRLADVGPVAAGFWRLALAAPLLFLLTRFARQPIPRLSAGLWIMLALGGLFFAADLASWHAGILRTRLANATLFGNVTSFLFALYGFLIARRLPDRNQAVALLLAAFGVVLLLGRSYELSPENMLGDLLCLCAGLFYAGYLIMVERARGSLAPLPTLAIATLAGVLPLLLFALLLGERILPGAWWALALLALGSQVIGQGLMVYAIGYLPPVVIGLGFLLQPIIAAIIGWIAYGERLGTGDLIGALAIGIALVLVRRRPR
ncbi:MAG TPA: DMT family transporter [Sphingomonadaceae bacterium]|nr:DMT family transporter [Sphingomonadaceae bacterium]